MSKDYMAEYHRWLDAGACEPIDDEKEIEECFYKDLKFGTGGIRAIMGPGPNKLNKYTIRKNTEGFARFIESKGEDAKKKGVVIACDNRRNSQFFCEEAAKVLATHDIHVYLFESLRTTPELSFAVRYLGAQGVLISLHLITLRSTTAIKHTMNMVASLFSEIRM